MTVIKTLKTLPNPTWVAGILEGSARTRQRDEVPGSSQAEIRTTLTAFIAVHRFDGTFLFDESGAILIGHTMPGYPIEIYWEESK